MCRLPGCAKKPYKVKLWRDSVQDWQVKVTKGWHTIGKRDTVTKGHKGYEKAKRYADAFIEDHKQMLIDSTELGAMPTKWTVPAPPTRAQLQERITRLEAELEIS